MNTINERKYLKSVRWNPAKKMHSKTLEDQKKTPTPNQKTNKDKMGNHSLGRRIAKKHFEEIAYAT